LVTEDHEVDHLEEITGLDTITAMTLARRSIGAVTGSSLIVQPSAKGISADEIETGGVAQGELPQVAHEKSVKGLSTSFRLAE